MAAMENEPNFTEFTEEFTVTPEMIDRNNHMNNVYGVQWIQDIAIHHSDTCGGTKVMESLGASWMIRTNHIEYKAQAFLGDVIRGTTWVPEYSRITTNRYCKFVRVSDGKEVFSSVTTWVLIDTEKERPIAIPEHLKDCFRKA